MGVGVHAGVPKFYLSLLSGCRSLCEHAQSLNLSSWWMLVSLQAFLNLSRSSWWVSVTKGTCPKFTSQQLLGVSVFMDIPIYLSSVSKFRCLRQRV